MPHKDNDGLDVKEIAEEIVATKDMKFFRDYLAEHMTGKNYYYVIKSLNKSNPDIIKDLINHTPTQTLSKAMLYCVANEKTEARDIILSNCDEKKLVELLTAPPSTASDGKIEGVNHNLGINVKTRSTLAKR